MVPCTQVNFRIIKNTGKEPKHGLMELNTKDNGLPENLMDKVFSHLPMAANIKETLLPTNIKDKVISHIPMATDMLIIFSPIKEKD